MNKLGAGTVALAVGAALAMAAPSTAAADDIDKMGGELVKYEAEVKQIGNAVTNTKSLGSRRGNDVAQRRLINAQVSFGVGDYDDAAIMLFDIVEQGSGSRLYDEALYYLAESLFQKKDYMGARNYFVRLVDELGANSDFYQQALERLIELSLKLDDDTDVDKYLQALSNVPASQQRDSVPYVRGRYMYFNDDFAGALGAFAEVGANSDYYVRAQYFTGATHIAQGNLGEAAKVYEALIQRQPKTDDDKKVVELAHMALGRLFYERDQATKAIDQYLMVSRKSDLFDEALYEVAWVYVKDKQFDKALRALELLELSSPNSPVAPDVRILEGNLRIRKAQRVEETGKGNSLEEYNRAMDVFTVTRDTYEQAREAIQRIVEQNEDPRQFVNQITGRTEETFDIETQLPEVAVEWLRREKEVSRVIDVDTDLVAIRSDIEEATKTIKRLERAINSPSRVNIFPKLAEKSARLIEIFESVQAMRGELTVQESELVSKHSSAEEAAEYEQLRARRLDLKRELDALPGAKQSYTERVAEAQGKYEELGKRAQQLSVLVDATEATLVAVEKYMVDEGDSIDADERAEYEGLVEQYKQELAALREQLQAVRDDITLGKDQAGVGDQSAVQAAELREEYRQALDAEHAFLASIVGRMSGSDRTKAEQIGNLMSKASSVLGQIDIVNRTIDETIDRELAEVKRGIAEEKQRLAGYYDELAMYETDAQVLGGEVLSGHFGRVSQKFYEVLIRSDVGVVDVAWASKEAAERTLKRLTLEESRARRVLDEQFGDVARDPPPGVNGEVPDGAGPITNGGGE